MIKLFKRFLRVLLFIFAIIIILTNLLYIIFTFNPCLRSQPSQVVRYKVAIADMHSNIHTALELYKRDNASYPTTEEGLDALGIAPDFLPSWNGPYIRKVPLDPWKNKYQYAYPGVHPDSGYMYDLYSLGKDGIKSLDDIMNWDTETAKEIYMPKKENIPFIIFISICIFIGIPLILRAFTPKEQRSYKKAPIPLIVCASLFILIVLLKFLFGIIYPYLNECSKEIILRLLYLSIYGTSLSVIICSFIVTLKVIKRKLSFLWWLFSLFTMYFTISFLLIYLPLTVY